MLKKKGDSRMSIRRRTLVLDPEEYQPKQTGEKHAPAYQEEKEKNLQEESMAQNRLSRFNVEKDREIKRSPHTPEEALAAEMKKLDQYASEKQAFMLKVNTDPLASSNCDLMLDSLFEDEAALNNYSGHPAHVAVANGKVRPFTASRVCMDYTV